MDQVNHFYAIFGNGLDMTFILLSLVIVDTVLGVGWRVKKRRAIFSNKFNSGLIVNCGVSIIPAILYELNHLPGHIAKDGYKIIAVIIAIGIGSSLAQSIISNYHLLGYKEPAFLTKFVNTFLKDEVEGKINRNDKKN